MRKMISRALLVMAMLLHAGALYAADKPLTMVEVLAVEESATATEGSDMRAPIDDYYRETPRSSMTGFLSFVRRGDYTHAGEYLDTRYLQGSAAELSSDELAHKLKVILDGQLWVDVGAMSDNVAGHADDNLPSYRDLIGVIRTDRKIYQLWMQRVPSDYGRDIWKISNRTLELVPELYEHYGYGPVEEYLSSHVPSVTLFSVALWEWVLALALLALAYIALKPVCMLIVFLIARTRPRLAVALTPFINRPAHLLAALLLARAWHRYFHTSLEASAIGHAGTLRIVVIAWLAMMLVALGRDYFSWRLDQQNRMNARVLLKPLATVLRLVIFVSAFLVWLSNIGYNVTTVVAGLGIGGLAIALGAQKSFENLIGTIIIYASAPIRVGNYCIVNDVIGKVEEVGLWSTRIRTLDRTIVFIPNSQLASGVIENLSLRDKFPFSRTLYLTHETPKEKIENVMARVVEVLEQHEMVDDSVRRVHLDAIGEFGFEVCIKAFIQTVNATENKHAVAEINLAINKVVSDAGVEYAKPLLPTTKAAAVQL